MAVPAPVVAACYKWLSTDTVAAYSTSAASGYPVANVTDANTMFNFRTTDADTDSGASFTLASSMSVYGIEAVNVEMAATEKMQIRLYSDTVGGVLAVRAGAGPVVVVPSGVWTSHTQTTDWQPTRANWALGIDNVDTGPTPAATPEVASSTVKAGIVSFDSALGSRTYWELAFIGLAVNAKSIGTADQNSLSPSVVRLRSGGVGFRWELTWPRLSMLEVAYLRSIQAGTDGGDWPFFFWPLPGQKSATGIIAGNRYTAMTRGGLARMLSFEASEYEEVGSTQYGVNCRLSAESWQEVPIG